MDENTANNNTIYALTASPDFAADNTCFAAGAAGLVRSTDGGMTWQNAYASLNLDMALTTASVAVSPSFANDDTLFAGVLGGILRSADRGESWQVIELPSPPPFVSVLAVSPNFERDGLLFAGTAEDGVFCSRDRGSRWNACNFGLLDLNVLDMSISPGFAVDETIFIAAESGIFRSTNGGRAWREVDFPVDVAPVLRLALSPKYANDGILFAGTEEHGLWMSKDRGRTWKRIAVDAITGSVDGILLDSDYPATPHLAILHDQQSLISYDGGQIWQSWPPQSVLERQLSCILAPNGLHAGAPLLVGLSKGGALRI